MMNIQQKLQRIKSILLAENASPAERDSASEIAHTLIIAGYCDQGGGYTGRKIVEHMWGARLNRIEEYFNDPECGLQFFETKEEAENWVNQNPTQFTPYQGDALSGGTS